MIFLKNNIHRFVLRPYQFLTLSFMLIILTGAFLLMLPISSRTGESTDFVASLFTSTTATCVTGLVVFDTYTHWSVFGKCVILALIQIGGLGLMTFAAAFSLFVRRRVSMRERIIMSQSLGLSDMSGIVRIMKHIIIATFIIEGVGAAFLASRFIPDFGVVKGICYGIFHSVSAMCNAGIDILGEFGQYSSLNHYINDPIVNLTIMFLIVVGGLGFFVWEDIYNRVRYKKRLTFYAKFVLIITAALILIGAVIFFLFEYDNTKTFGNLPLSGKILAPFFASVTPRTAGFSTINYADMTGSSQALTMILMFIGGSSGSTAGGIKTVTFGILAIAIFEISRGRRSIVIRERKISNDNVLRALSVAGIVLFLILLGTFIIAFAEHSKFTVSAIMFDCVSAIATVGLSTGITPQLSDLSRIVLILLMYFGRVGILTITYSIVLRFEREKDLLSYPEGKILIG